MKKDHLFVLLMAVLACFSACEQEVSFVTDGRIDLRFSLDTLRFDTVFTDRGSATRYFKIINPSDQAVKVGKITLENGTNSFFRMNVDGNPGDEIAETIIWGNDSVYVFVEVTIDPDLPESISPFVIEDKVLIQSGNNIQKVNLEAWGQNANYFPSRFNKGVPVVLTCEEKVVWDDPKPYVIFGEIFIDSCLLEIAAGARIHLHGGIAQNDQFGVFNDGFIYVLQDGKLQVKGTPEAPVMIQGDRLETSFLDEAGQWYGIIIGRGSSGSTIENATIRNSIFGVYVDSTGEVTLDKVQIYNTASSGIVGYHSKITATNTLVYNNGADAVQLILGGDYKMDHCTVASYGIDASALAASNFFCYDATCSSNASYRLNAEFRNCIFFGSQRDEITFDDGFDGAQAGMFNVNFENCIVRVDDLLEADKGAYSNFFADRCEPCINAERTDVLFVDANADDYHLDTLSIAINAGISIPGISKDIANNDRDTQPDIGCYEYQQ
ncbi:MAG: right-handed parallel beta-helix repeat-containing protein [Saprospiraceae bacterium]